MKINYGFIVYLKADPEKEIWHFCGFEEQPTDKDKDELMEELKTDKSFGLVEEANAGCLEIAEADAETVKEFDDFVQDEEAEELEKK